MTYPLTTALLAAEAALPERDLLSADEVAGWFCVDRKTVCGAASRGDIPHQRVGKRMVFSRAALAAWLAGRRTGAHGATQATRLHVPPGPAATTRIQVAPVPLGSDRGRP